MHNQHHHRPPPPPSARRDNDEGSLVCYGIVVATASLLLLAVLAATVSIAKACALAGAAAVLFSASGWVSRRCAADGTLPPTTTALAMMPAPRATRAGCGLVDAAIDALPAFAYARGAGACGGEGSSSGGKCRRRALCSVCLEDVEAGEMVRQLPACGHLFYVGCIDMWLHSHATCPLCRRLVSPQQVSGAKLAAAAAADPPDGALPPV